MRTDLFSFGAVLYEMGTGRQVFAGATTAVIHDQILNRAPAPLIKLNTNLPPKLEEIINKALEKDRDLRYQHASDIRTDLKRLKRDTTSGRSAAVPGAVAGASRSRAGEGHGQDPRSSAGETPALPLTPALSQPTALRRWPLWLAVSLAVVLAGLASGLFVWHRVGTRPDSFNLVCTTCAGKVKPLLRNGHRQWMINPLPSPDGKYLAFQAQTWDSNVWMLENLEER